MSRRLRMLSVAAALVLVLAGCAPGNELHRAPHANGTQLPTHDTGGWLMPLQLEGQPVYDTGWVTEPQGLDGIFLAPREVEGKLEFIAVGSSGQVLWSAERPIGCTGFVLTRTNKGQSLAVLSDVSSTKDALATTTASAYDLGTGELVWGPVQVPGPHLGPGLVYAAPSNEPMGATGRKTALDPATGEVAATEGTGSIQRIIGEYDGIVLSSTNTDLEATFSRSGSTAWRIDAERLGGDLAHLRAAVEEDTDRDHALLQLSPKDHALLSLEHGQVLSTGIRQVHTDSITGTHLILAGNEMRALDPEGNELWQLSIDEQTTIAGPGEVLVFLQSSGAIRVHNIASGNIVPGYPADGNGLIVLPVLLSGPEAAIVTDHSRYYLVGNPETGG